MMCVSITTTCVYLINLIVIFFFFVLLYFYIVFFFFNDTATTEIYTLSLHDALPISKILSGYKPDQNKIRKYLAALKTVGLDLEFWRDTNVSLDDMKKNDPGEYKKKIELLAKVLADEYFRVTDQSRLLVGKGQNQ